MNEDSAREVTLLQAFETAQPPSPSWSDDDRAWATRLALHDGAADDTEAFIVRRARHAVQRLAPREPAAARWLAQRVWRSAWIGWAVVVGLIAGLLADSIGSSQRINLLAPPLLAVLAWNAVVYLLLIGHALAHLLTRRTRPGALVRLTQRLLRFDRKLPKPNGGPAWQRFAALWLPLSARLSAARAETLLHAAAAALAAGLIAGLYLRGLVLDYRAAWESTFLSANVAHAVLATLLAPASVVSGVALPDATAFEALRTAHGAVAGDSAGASAAPWIHLLALTLALFVLLPRALLAGAGALRAAWLAGHLPLPLQDAYFQHIVRHRRGDVARVAVVPYATTPTAQAAIGLQALLAPALGDGLQIRIAPTAAFGAEDDDAAPATFDAGTTLAIVLFDLAATPEAEHQGRYARQLAARAPAGAATIVLVDAAGFKRRFTGDAARLAQRRETWHRFGDSLGTTVVCADLDAPELSAISPALQLAMRNPVTRSRP